MLMRKMKANVMHNATKKNKKNYFIVFDYIFKNVFCSGDGFFTISHYTIPLKKYNYINKGSTSLSELNRSSNSCSRACHAAACHQSPSLISNYSPQRTLIFIRFLI